MKFILTLSNVRTIEPSLSTQIVISRIEELSRTGGPAKILVVTEQHKRGKDFHFHIVVVFKKGLSKNTYISLFRGQFPLFLGLTLHVQGVKSLTKVTNYVFKRIGIAEMVKFVSGVGSESILCNVDISNFLRFIKNHEHIYIVRDIMNHSTLEDFLNGSFIRSLKNIVIPRVIDRCWKLSRSLVHHPECIEVFDTVPNISTEEWLDLIHKWNITSHHLYFLNRLLYFIGIKEGYFDQVVKSKNLLVIGRPNVGKTSLLFKLQEVFLNPDLFFFVGSRKNDFSYFPVGQRPIIVFDDVLSYPELNWDEGILLKVLAHEPFVVDVKYGQPVAIKPTNSIIITNTFGMFSDPKHSALLNRVVIIELLEMVK